MLISAATCGFQVTINELFPTENRYSGVSSSYNISNAIFGGSAPVIATLLVSHTGNPSSPAYYLIGASIVTLIIISTMPETVKSKYFQIEPVEKELIA
jgi:MFS transporter, MHS family, proline/betaine transporter